MEILIGLLGMVSILGISYGMSENRSKINWRVVAVGIGIQILLAVLLLKVPGFNDAAQSLGDGIRKIVDYALAGAGFVLGQDAVAGMPYEKFRFIIVVGSTIIVMSALSAVLYYLRVLEWVVRLLAMGMRWTLGITGVEALSSAASIFAGQVESQTLIRPYIPKVTRSQLFTMLTVNMATIAGTVLVTYTSMGMDPVFLILASIISAPAGIVVSKMMIPETASDALGDESALKIERQGSNVFDAFAVGTREGWDVARNVMIMLIAAIAFVTMANDILSFGLIVFGAIFLTMALFIGYFLYKGKTMRGRAIRLSAIAGVLAVGVAVAWFAGIDLTVENIGGVILTPIALLLGIPWGEAFEVARMMSTEILVNEFVSYQMLATHIDAGTLTAKTQLIATIALCGFANLSSIAINLGGLSAMAPERRGEIAALGFRALIAANLATWMTAALAGILY